MTTDIRQVIQSDWLGDKTLVYLKSLSAKQFKQQMKIDAYDYAQNSVLMLCLSRAQNYHDYELCAMYLLDKKVDVHQKNINGITALWWTLCEKRTGPLNADIAIRLVEQGADPFIKIKDDYLLSRAIYHDQQRVIEHVLATLDKNQLEKFKEILNVSVITSGTEKLTNPHIKKYQLIMQSYWEKILLEENTQKTEIKPKSLKI